MNDVSLRPMRAGDLDRVLALEVELFGASAWSYGMLAEELGGPGRWYVVATQRLPQSIGPAPVVGYAGLWFDGDAVQIMTIGVSLTNQKCGIGALLLQAIVDQARELQAESVLLEVAVNNGPAIAMYQKFGFEQLGVRRRYYQPEDVDAYTMRLPLPASGDE